MRLPEKPIDWKKTLGEKGDKVFKLIQKRNLFEKAVDFNRRYLYWNELRHRVSDKTEQKYIWTLMKFLRSERYEEVPYAPLRLKFANLPELNRYLHKFDMLLAGNIEIQSKKLGLDKRYVVSSLMEEAIASSILEGAATTRKAAKEMLRQKRKPLNRHEQMVANGYETMQEIVKRKDKPLTPEFLLEIQSMVTKDTLENEQHSGSFRDTNGVVVADSIGEGTVYHVPPDHKKIPNMVKELCDFANSDDEEFIHPIIKGVILHFLIGYIHPFYDGNGRTARSIFYWYVLSKGYWLFEYMALSRRILRSKKKYGLAYLYTEYDELDLTYFIKYNLEAVDEALDNLLEYLKSKQKEKRIVLELIERNKALNLRQATILEELIDDPGKTFSIQEVSETYDVAYQTARTDLLLLANLGYAKMRKIGKKFVFSFNSDKDTGV